MIKLNTKKYSLENFSNGHFFEEVADKDSFYLKKFFGGLSIYVYGRMVAFLCEHPGDKKYRGKRFKLDIWDGCLIPSVRENHKELLNLLDGTIVHPVIEKWLYLPQKSKHFESSMLKLADLVARKSSLIGVEPVLKAVQIKKKIESI